MNIEDRIKRIERVLGIVDLRYVVNIEKYDTKHPEHWVHDTHSGTQTFVGSYADAVAQCAQLNAELT